MKKIGLICLAVVLAVGVIGFGYANWTDTVVVEEVVNTGSVCVGIRDLGTNDDPGDMDQVLNASVNDWDPGYDTVDLVQVVYDKDVASCTSTNVTAKCLHEGVQFYAKVTETIVNAYPSYAPTMVLEVANCGSIPVIITGFDEVVSGPNPELNAFTELLHWKIERDGVIVQEGSGETNLGAAVMGMQVDPCDVITITIKKHILQENAAGEVCPQGASVTFTETITFTQWNKAP